MFGIPVDEEHVSWQYIQLWQAIAVIRTICRTIPEDHAGSIASVEEEDLHAVRGIA